MQNFLADEKSLVKYVGICNVGMLSEPLWLRELLPDAVFFNPDYSTPTALKNRYATPETLGMDRFLVALGAWSRVQKGPILILDAGTALNWEFVNQNGEYLGGGIAPGMEMRFRALHELTRKLPFIKPALPIQLPALNGNSTENAILSGVINGFISEINGLIQLYQADSEGNLITFLTGGDTAFLVNHVKNINFADPDLLLWGIHTIIQSNFPDA